MLGSRNSKIYRVFSNTASGGETKAFLKLTLQPSVYPEFGLLHLLPVLMKARGVCSATSTLKHLSSSKEPWGFLQLQKHFLPTQRRVNSATDWGLNMALRIQLAMLWRCTTLHFCLLHRHEARPTCSLHFFTDIH